MKRPQRPLQIILLLIIFIMLPLIVLIVKQQQDLRQHAATGVQLFAVADKSVAKAGQTISYEIDMDTNNFPVDSIDLNLTYPADKMDIVSIDTDNSAFPTESSRVAGSGLITISRTSPSPIIGKKKILTLQFSVKQPVTYDVLHPAPGLTVMSLRQALQTGTLVTDKPVLPITATPFSFTTIFAAFFHLFGR